MRSRAPGPWDRPESVPKKVVLRMECEWFRHRTCLAANRFSHQIRQARQMHYAALRAIRVWPKYGTINA
jgi:hypothetical protein